MEVARKFEAALSIMRVQREQAEMRYLLTMNRPAEFLLKENERAFGEYRMQGDIVNVAASYLEREGANEVMEKIAQEARAKRGELRERYPYIRDHPLYREDPRDSIWD